MSGLRDEFGGIQKIRALVPAKKIPNETNTTLHLRCAGNRPLITVWRQLARLHKQQSRDGRDLRPTGLAFRSRPPRFCRLRSPNSQSVLAPRTPPADFVGMPPYQRLPAPSLTAKLTRRFRPLSRLLDTRLRAAWFKWRLPAPVLTMQHNIA